MNNLRARAAAGIKIGDTFTLSRTYRDEEIELFAKISRDYNPVHFDAEFAAAQNFRAPVCHGLLTASLATEIGGQIGWLASGLNLRLKRPVYPGETVTCQMTITEVDERLRALATLVMINQDGVTVLEGDISGVLPSPEKRELLARMLAEGDPTNALTHAC